MSAFRDMMKSGFYCDNCIAKRPSDDTRDIVTLCYDPQIDRNIYMNVKDLLCDKCHTLWLRYLEEQATTKAARSWWPFKRKV